MTKKKDKEQSRINPWAIGGGLAVLALGTGAYFYFREEKTTTSEAQEERGASVFSLGFGSRGEWVRKLQEALIEKYGASILPRFGADGIWGNETQAALKSKAIQTVFTSLNQLKNLLSKLGGFLSGVESPEQKAELFALHINGREFQKVLELLGSIVLPAEFNAVSKSLEQFYVFTKKRKLSGALFEPDMFWTETQKNRFRMEVERIGRKAIQDSISGNKMEVGGRKVFSGSSTVVWAESGSMEQAPAGLFLGTAIKLNGPILSLLTPEQNILFTEHESVELQ